MRPLQTGQIIQRLRRQAGLSQQQLAERLFVSRDLVVKWEKGQRRPSQAAVGEMAAVFGVSPDEIRPLDDLILAELARCLPPRCAVEAAAFPALLNAFLRQLPEKEADLFIRRYHDRQDADEIAAFYGLTPENVRQVLHRTRKKLKRYLTEVSA